MDEEERIIIIQTMIDNNGIEEGEFAEYEKEALQSLLDSYKFQRRQLNDAFSNGWIHKDKIKEMKEFYINEYTNKNITLIPLKNIIENINVLLEEK